MLEREPAVFIPKPWWDGRDECDRFEPDGGVSVESEPDRLAGPGDPSGDQEASRW